MVDGLASFLLAYRLCLVLNSCISILVAHATIVRQITEALHPLLVTLQVKHNTDCLMNNTITNLTNAVPVFQGSYKTWTEPWIGLWTLECMRTER